MQPSFKAFLNRGVFFLLAVSLPWSNTTASYLDEIRKLNPIAHWTFDGSSTSDEFSLDEIQGYNLTAAGGAALGARGVPGADRGARFPGGGGRLRLTGAGPGGGGGAAAAAAWARPDTAGAGTNRPLMTTRSGDSGWALGCTAGDAWAVAAGDGAGGAAVAGGEGGAATCTAGAWALAVGSYDNATGEVTLWINGLREATATAAGGTLAPQGGATLQVGGGAGAGEDGGEGYWEGRADEVSLLPAGAPGGCGALGLYNNLTGNGTASNAAYSAYVFASLSPLGYWGMEEQGGAVADASGAGRAANVSGACYAASSARTALGAARQFDRTESAYLSIPNADDFYSVTSGDFSVAAWVNVGRMYNGTRQTVLSNRNNGNRGFLLEVTPEGRFSFQVGFTDSSNVVGIESQATVGPGEWHFVAATLRLDAQHFFLYLDGAFDSDKTYSDKTWRLSSTRPLLIGAGYDSNKDFQYFHGLIDEVAVFDSGLTHCDVQKMYQIATSTESSPLAVDGSQLYEQRVLARDPTRYWGFNRVGTDATALLDDVQAYPMNLTRGVCTNVSSPSWPEAVAGYAIQFHSYEEIFAQAADGGAWAPGGGGGQLSVALWFRSEGDGGTSRELLSTLTENYEGFSLNCHTNDHLRFLLGTGNSTAGISSSTNYCNNNRWHHAIVTYSSDAEESLMFIDGQFDNFKDLSGYTFSLNPSNSAPFLIGAGLRNTDPTLGYEYFYGKLDEVAVFDKILSTCDAEDLYYIVNGTENPNVAKSISSGLYHSYVVNQLNATLYFDFEDLQADKIIDVVQGLEGNISSGACVNRSSSTDELGHAVMFNKHDNAHMSIPCDKCTDFPQLSVALWVNAEGYSGTNRVIASTFLEGLGWYLECGGNREVYRWNWGLGGLNDTWVRQIQSQTRCNESTWRFVVGTIDNHAGVVSLYVDGVLESQKLRQAGAVRLNSTGPLYLGGGYEYGAFEFNTWHGRVDEVAIFDYVLTVSQIQGLINASNHAVTLSPSVAPTAAPTPAPTLAPSNYSTALRTSAEILAVSETWVQLNLSANYDGTIFYLCKTASYQTYDSVLGMGKTVSNVNANTAFEVSVQNLTADTSYFCHFIGKDLSSGLLAHPSLLNASLLTFTTAPEPPEVTSAQFTNTGGALRLVMNSATDQGTGGLGLIMGEAFECNLVLEIPGETEYCQWPSTTTVVVYLGNKASVDVGDKIEVKAGTIKAKCFDQDGTGCFYWSTNTGRNVTVAAPDLALYPTIVPSYQAAVSRCSDISLDISESTGSGGRALLVDWKLSIPHNPNITAHLNHFQNQTKASVPNSLLVPGTNYTFEIAVTNLFNNSAVESVTVLVAPENIPELGFDGPHTRTINRWEILSILAAGAPGACGPSNASFAALSYSWASSSHPELASSSANPRAMRLPAHTLDLRGWYAFRCTVRDNTTGLSNSDTVQVYVAESDISAAFLQGQYRILAKNDALKLDVVVEDLDQDDGYADGSYLGYNWTCIKNDGISCGDTVENNMGQASELHVAGGKLDPGSTYRFTVNISYSYNRSATATTEVLVANFSLPRLSVLSSFPSKVNADARQAILAKVVLGEDDSAEGPASAEWALSPLSPAASFSAAASLAGAASTPLAAALPAGAKGAINLAVLPGRLRAPATYVFRLTAWYDAAHALGPGARAAAEVSVHTNAPPSSGTYEVAPLVGRVLEDTFTLACAGWVDDDLPLRYSFLYRRGGLDAVLQSRRLGTSSRGGVALPQGSGRNHSVETAAQVFDALGAGARRAYEVVVLPPSAVLSSATGALSARAGALLAAALGSLDPEAAANAARAVVSVLNTQNCTEAPDCSALNREECGDGDTSEPNSCGACLEGYSSTTDWGNANTLCVATSTGCSNGVQDGNETDADCGGGGCPGCGVGEACLADSDCAYRLCGSGGVCKAPLKSCAVPDCNGRGACRYYDSYGAELEKCREGRACDAYCDCDPGYKGHDGCEYTKEEYLALKGLREGLVAGLVDAFAIVDLDEETVNSLSGTVAGVLTPIKQATKDATMAAVDLLEGLTASAAAAGEVAPSTAAFFTEALGLALRSHRVEGSDGNAMHTGLSASVDDFGYALAAPLVPGEDPQAYSDYAYRVAANKLEKVAGYNLEAVGERNAGRATAAAACRFGPTADGVFLGGETPVVLAEMVVNPYLASANSSAVGGGGGGGSNATHTSGLIRVNVDLETEEAQRRLTAYNATHLNVSVYLPNYMDAGYENASSTMELQKIQCEEGMVGTYTADCNGRTFTYECNGQARVGNGTCAYGGIEPQCEVWNLEGDAYAHLCTATAYDAAGTTCVCTVYSSEVPLINQLDVSVITTTIGTQFVENWEYAATLFTRPGSMELNYTVIVTMCVFLGLISAVACVTSCQDAAQKALLASLQEEEGEVEGGVPGHDGFRRGSGRAEMFALKTNGLEEEPSSPRSSNVLTPVVAVHGGSSSPNMTRVIAPDEDQPAESKTQPQQKRRGSRVGRRFSAAVREVASHYEWGSGGGGGGGGGRRPGRRVSRFALPNVVPIQLFKTSHFSLFRRLKEENPWFRLLANRRKLEAQGGGGGGGRAHQHSRAVMAAHVAVACTTLMAVDALMYDVAYPDAGPCASYAVQEACLAQPSPYDARMTVCSWSEEGGGYCYFNSPPITWETVIVISVLTYVLFLPIHFLMSRFIGLTIERPLHAPEVDFEAEEDAYGTAMSHALARYDHKKVPTGKKAPPQGKAMAIWGQVRRAGRGHHASPRSDQELNPETGSRHYSVVRSEASDASTAASSLSQVGEEEEEEPLRPKGGGLIAEGSSGIGTGQEQQAPASPAFTNTQHRRRSLVTLADDMLNTVQQEYEEGKGKQPQLSPLRKLSSVINEDSRKQLQDSVLRRGSQDGRGSQRRGQGRSVSSAGKGLQYRLGGLRSSLRFPSVYELVDPTVSFVENEQKMFFAKREGSAIDRSDTSSAELLDFHAALNGLVARDREEFQGRWGAPLGTFLYSRVRRSRRALLRSNLTVAWKAKALIRHLREPDASYCHMEIAHQDCLTLGERKVAWRVTHERFDRNKIVPCWVHVLGWIVVVLWLAATSFYTLLFGLQKTDSLTFLWLLSFLLGYFQDLFAIIPFRVLLLYRVLPGLISRKANLEDVRRTRFYSASQLLARDFPRLHSSRLLLAGRLAPEEEEELHRVFKGRVRWVAAATGAGRERRRATLFLIALGNALLFLFALLPFPVQDFVIDANLAGISGLAVAAIWQAVSHSLAGLISVVVVFALLFVAMLLRGKIKKYVWNPLREKYSEIVHWISYLKANRAQSQPEQTAPRATPAARARGQDAGEEEEEEEESLQVLLSPSRRGAGRGPPKEETQRRGSWASSRASSVAGQPGDPSSPSGAAATASPAAAAPPAAPGRQLTHRPPSLRRCPPSSGAAGPAPAAAAAAPPPAPAARRVAGGVAAMGVLPGAQLAPARAGSRSGGGSGGDVEEERRSSLGETATTGRGATPAPARKRAHRPGLTSAPSGKTALLGVLKPEANESKAPVPPLTPAAPMRQSIHRPFIDKDTTTQRKATGHEAASGQLQTGNNSGNLGATSEERPAAAAAAGDGGWGEGAALPRPRRRAPSSSAPPGAGEGGGRGGRAPSVSGAGRQPSLTTSSGGGGGGGVPRRREVSVALPKPPRKTSLHRPGSFRRPPPAT